MTSFRDAVERFLEGAVLSRADVDRFLDPDEPKWARFDSELGYVPHPCEVPDGANGAISTYRYGALGERLLVNYAARTPRINSYGDSFTQCHQVSDGETWQEYLAAHIGEPIRNFGVGGYGVYQAYLRLCRVEATEAATDHVLFNVFLDDHYRNLDAYRLLRVGRSWWDERRSLATGMLHANPWRHVRFDPSMNLVERPNLCPSEESLYNLCDKDFLVDTFGDDLVVQLLVARELGRFDVLDQYAETARALGVPLDTTTRAARARSAELFYDRCAFRSSIVLLERLRGELSERGKKLLVLLSYPAEAVADACRGRSRPDIHFVSELDASGIEYVDSLAAHRTDYSAFSIGPDEYIDRYYAGHYTSAGNHFFGFAIREPLLAWLDTAPPAYRGPSGLSGR